MNFKFEEELLKILNKYKEGSKEPLDGDEVDDLVDLLRNQINLIEGNITKEEYDADYFGD